MLHERFALEQAAIEGHVQVEGKLLGHVNCRGVAAHAFYRVALFELIGGRLTKARLRRWQYAMGGIRSQLVEMVRLGG